MNARQLFRNQLKKLYTQNLKKDAALGKQINMLMQQLFSLEKTEMFADDKKKTFDELKNQIDALRKEKLTRIDFPKFHTFYQYCKKHNIRIEDLVV